MYPLLSLSVGFVLNFFLNLPLRALENRHRRAHYGFLMGQPSEGLGVAKECLVLGL